MTHGPANKTDYAALIDSPGYENCRSMLRGEIVDTRPLKTVISHVTRLQQQVAARLDAGAFWSGDNSLPIDGALFAGSSGFGKSFALRYITETMPPIALLDGGTAEPNPLYVETPGGTVGKLAQEVLRRADGREIDRQPKDQDAPVKAVAALNRYKFTMVALDEISRVINPQLHATRGLAVQSHLVWTMIIHALNSFIPVAAAGVPNLLDSFQIVDKDKKRTKVRREAQRRMKVVLLPDLVHELDRDMLEKAIVAYCGRAGVESMLTESDHIVPRLIHASFYQAGTALEWIQKAVAMAKVRPRGKLNREDFAFVYGDMTSAARTANPFLVSGWDRIDIGKIAPKNFTDAALKERAA